MQNIAMGMPFIGASVIWIAAAMTTKKRWESIISYLAAVFTFTIACLYFASVL